MSRFWDHYKFRARLVSRLRRDLIGPSALDETLEDAPLVRYAAGILYPKDSGHLDEGQDTDAQDEDDTPVAAANIRYPSSLGMTFAVDTQASSVLTVRIKAGRYVETPREAKTDSAEDAPKKTDKVWKRQIVSVTPVTIDISRPVEGSVPVASGLKLYRRVRSADADSTAAVTLVLMNDNVSRANGQRDAEAFFQCGLSVAAPDKAAVFVERPVRGDDSDEERAAYRLLYRNTREFGVGHGCSVDWRPRTATRCRRVFTEVMPLYALKLADSNPGIDLPSLGMKYCRDTAQSEVTADLGRLCDGYQDWIDERQAEVGFLPDDLQEVAGKHLALCTEAVERMRTGVAALSVVNSLVWEAFRLANAAMLQQRARTVWLGQNKPTPAPTEDDSARWRPFQIAFLMLCLRGIAEPTSPDRDFADLLWFPTGGGKTEAYLGLIAFTVFHRRLARRNGGGVTALMRYTLRLLTIQQFERAALLICCCENIRRSRKDLGSDPVSLGLWVGEGATPNTRAGVRTALNRLRANRDPEDGNPVQIHSCSWCGTPLDHRNYYLADDVPRMVIFCRQPDCMFGKQLPVYLIDEDIYDFRPTLIIATVDKFASLPWKGETASLFNRGMSGTDRPPPPELIVQDELHLISGPLGTLTGLYETAVDLLCTDGGIRPKVIASTATIRRADQQTRALFDRRIRQFPPPGLDAGNSYFALEASANSKGTRLYVGVMAPGISHTTLLVRTYAALLQYAEDLPAPDAVKDSYLTLVGYFNSLRVLGGARMQVQDDVSDRMGLLARQAGVEKRDISERIELTSREKSGDIPHHLKRMAAKHPSTEAVDVILATNMISVGVDVDRLGLMAVMGQPQSTSEYIQSTSRVGRSLPGLVVVLYNSSRSRDRSHYESFMTYHSALYRQVESTSVTPFSPRARDRGLHAVYIALARLLVPELRQNDAAARITQEEAALDPVAEFIVERAGHVSPDEADAVRSEIKEILTRWLDRAQTSGLRYQDGRHVASALLTEATGADADMMEAFPTLRSLRDVDAESNLVLVP